MTEDNVIPLPAARKDAAAISADESVKLDDFARRYSTRMLVILFTDIVDSTAGKDRRGDRTFLEIETVHHAIFTKVLKEIDDAREVRSDGDSYIYVFLKPSDAVRFALRALALHREDDRIRQWPDPFAYRTGIHLGETIVEKREAPNDRSGDVKDIKGLQADTAHRIMSLARGGQILCSRQVFDDARQALKSETVAGVGEIVWHDYGAYALKGRETPIGVGEVGEKGMAPFVRPGAGEKAAPVAGADDRVTGWRPGLDAVLPDTNWMMARKLGQGGFGEVWLACDKNLPLRRTVFKFCLRKRDAGSLRREADIFNRLIAREGAPPPDIAEVIDVNDVRPPFYIRLHYEPGGDLRDWITGAGKTAPVQARIAVALQMIRALGRLHAAGFVHRDVKPSNFLVTGTPPPGAAPTVKLTDFGVGQAALCEAVASDVKTFRTLDGRTWPALGAADLAVAVGAYFYVAPELVVACSADGRLAQNATPAADIFSLGVALYQLFSGKADLPPGIDLADIEDPVLRADVRACLRRDPAGRPSGDELTRRLGAYEERRARVKYCPVCATLNDDEARFCDQCGLPLPQADGQAPPKALRCAACGELNDGRARFCDQCGDGL